MGEDIGRAFMEPGGYAVIFAKPHFTITAIDLNISRFEARAEVIALTGWDRSVRQAGKCARRCIDVCAKPARSTRSLRVIFLNAQSEPSSKAYTIVEYGLRCPADRRFAEKGFAGTAVFVVAERRDDERGFGLKLQIDKGAFGAGKRGQKRGQADKK